METKYFASLMYDRIFKTLWTSNHEYTNIFLNRIIKYITNYDIKDYILTINELPLKSKNSIASRVDILLVSKDKSRIINIELNPKLKKTTNNKNLSYLFKLAAEYYKHNDKDKYLHNIDVIQINLNGYYHQNKDILISKYTLYDKQYNLTKHSIIVYDVYLPRAKKLCYDEYEDIYNDLSLFTCTSYEEMQKYIKDNKERKDIMEMLRKIAIDPNVPTYDYGEYLESLHKEIAMEARKEGLEQGIKEGKEQGLEQGIEQGLEQGKCISAINLIEQGFSIEEASKLLKIDQNIIKKALKKDN